MLETFEAKKPFYPLISFSVSVIVLIFGMLFSKNLLAFAFATAIFVLYSAFGLFKSTWKMTVAMAICGLIIGGLSFLSNRSLDAFWQTLLRMILLGLCAVPMVSTSPCDLTRCLAKLKCPRVITLGMLVTLKFIPVLVGEIKQMGGDEGQRCKYELVPTELHLPCVYYSARYANHRNIGYSFPFA